MDFLSIYLEVDMRESTLFKTQMKDLAGKPITSKDVRKLYQDLRNWINNLKKDWIAGD
jgi:hypothetical protein